MRRAPDSNFPSLKAPLEIKSHCKVRLTESENLLDIFHMADVSCCLLKMVNAQ